MVRSGSLSLVLLQSEVGQTGATSNVDFGVRCPMRDWTGKDSAHTLASSTRPRIGKLPFLSGGLLRVEHVNTAVAGLRHHLCVLSLEQARCHGAQCEGRMLEAGQEAGQEPSFRGGPSRAQRATYRSGGGAAASFPPFKRASGVNVVREGRNLH